MNKRQTGTFAALTILLALCICLFAHRFDNQFFQPDSPQAMNGILFLSESQLSGTKTHFLARGWVYYPDVLLSQGELAGYTGYRRYVNADGTDTVGNGSGTYRLTLALPAALRYYELDMPEVYSAYRLFVGGQQLLAVGNPDKDAYQPALSNTVVPFLAGGNVDLVLQVTDRSPRPSGLVHPPTFGTQYAVDRARDIRLTLRLLAAFTALAAAGTAAVFGLRIDRRRAVIGILLALTLAAQLAGPVVYALLDTVPLSWQLVHNVTDYLIFLLAVLLLGALYRMPWKATLIASLPPAVGLMLTALGTVGLLVLPPAAASAEAIFHELLYIYAAFCFLLLSLFALKKNRWQTGLVLSGACAFSVCLLVDLFLPLFAPVLGLDRVETGALLLTIGNLFSYWVQAAGADHSRLQNEKEYKQLGEHLRQQRYRHEQLSCRIRHTAQIETDIRHHLRLIRALAEQGKSEQILAYLALFDEGRVHKDAQKQAQLWSENPIADVLLAQFFAQAERQRTECDFRTELPARLAVDDSDLCILLSNLLENALEATARQKDGKRWIYLHCVAYEGKFELILDNSFDSWVVEREGQFLSRKPGRQGQGLASVRAILKKYGGAGSFSAKGTMFHANVVLPLGEPAPELPPELIRQMS